MKVFLTGGGGYIGSVTAKMLLDAGHAVTVFDNLERGHERALDRRAVFIRGDLRDRNEIMKAMLDARPDAVMHFAAYALVGESMVYPERYFANNVKGGINLAEAMLKAGTKRIVFSSTCATYGEPSDKLLTEDSPQRPTNPYGESKLMLEKILEWLRPTHGLDPIFLRYFNAAGATEEHGEDHEPETHIIPNVLKVALNGTGAVKVFGDDYNTPDGTCVRDYIHVWDLARAHVMALSKNTVESDAPSRAFNLGTGRGYSVLEVVEAARSVTKRKIPVEIHPRRPGDPPRLVADAGKASKILGWKPELGELEQIVESAWKWHSAHPNGYGA